MSNLVCVTKPVSLVQVGVDKFIRPLRSDSKTIYKKLLEAKQMTPKGTLNWALDLELPDRYLRSGFLFARKCTQDMFKITFQFKIMTQILPTNEYLQRYQVLDSNDCLLCSERDTTLHRIYQCNRILDFIGVVFPF